MAAFNISANLVLNPQSVNASAQQVQQALGRITGQASEFQKSLDASTARVFAFGATTSIISGISAAFSKLISNTIEVQAKLTEVNTILQASTSAFNDFRNTIFKVAQDTGQSFNVVAEGAAELARQGLGAEETAKRLEAALVLTRISGLGAEASVKALTSAINGFTSAGLSSEQIVNKIVAVDTKFAVSSKDLAEALSRTGSTAEDAGVSFDQLLGLVTAVEQRTARGGAVIGNAFKSIFTRLSRGTTIEDLKALGVEIDSSQNGIQKLQALSQALEKISDPNIASQIKELAGGVYQINTVSATLKDLSSETSIFSAAAAAAANATNEAFSKNAELNTTISSQINSLVVGLTSLSERVGNVTFGPIIENLVGLASKFTEFLNSALDPNKGNDFIQGLFAAIGSYLSGPGLVIVATGFLKIFTAVARFAKDGLKAVLEIGTETERVRSVEAGIVELLAKDQQLRNALADVTTTQAQKQQAIIAAIQQENALLKSQEQILRNIASVAVNKGVSGYSSSKGFSGKGYATGNMQEEATAMMLGASSTVKAKQGKGTIGGRKFLMNDQETEIPNFGRNGDSAVIPHYASGFVPNYAAKGRRVNDPEAMAKAAARIEARKGGVATLSDSEKKAILSNYEPISVNGLIGNMPTILTPNDNTKGINYNQEYDKANGAVLNYKFNSFAASNKDGLTENFKNDFGSDEIEQIAQQHILRQSGILASALGLTPAEPNSVGEIVQGEGFRGAIRAAAGALFEGAITTTLGLKAQNPASGGNFDVRNPSGFQKGKLNELFGAGAMPSNVADFKYSAEANKQSMAAKVLKEYGSLIKPAIDKRKVEVNGAFERALANKKASAGKAAGFIPNFNSMNVGIPVSQIRAHFDENGSPVAVTNTRDEPNGLSDAINREKKGQGMYAEGFVPNYAKKRYGKRTFNKELAETDVPDIATDVPDIAPQLSQLGATVTQSQSLFGKLNNIIRQKNKDLNIDTSKSFIIGLGLTASATLLEKNFGEASENTSALGRTIADTASSMSQFAAIGASFGPWGTAIGAGAGVLKNFFDAINKEAESRKKANETVIDSIKTEGVMNLVQAETNRVLENKKTGYVDLIAKMKQEGQSTDSLIKSRSNLAQKTQQSMTASETLTNAERENAKIMGNAKITIMEKWASEAELKKAQDANTKALEEEKNAINAYKTELLMATSNTQGVGKAMADLKKASVEFENKLAQEISALSSKKVSKTESTKEAYDVASQINSSKFDKKANLKETTTNVGKSVEAYREAKAKNEDIIQQSKTNKGASLGDNPEAVAKAVAESGKEFKRAIIESSTTLINKQTALQDRWKEIQNEILTKTQQVFNEFPNRLKESFARDVVDVGKLQNILKGVAEAKSAGRDLEAASAMANNADEFNNAVGVLGPEAMKTLYESVGLTVQSLKELQIAADKSKVANVPEELKPTLKAGLEKNSGKDVNEILDLNEEQKAVKQELLAVKEGLVAMSEALKSQDLTGGLQILNDALKNSVADVVKYNDFTKSLGDLSVSTTATLSSLNQEMLKRQQEIEQNKNKTAEQLSNMQQQIDRLQTTYNK